MRIITILALLLIVPVTADILGLWEPGFEDWIEGSWQEIYRPLGDGRNNGVMEYRDGLLYITHWDSPPVVLDPVTMEERVWAWDLPEGFGPEHQGLCFHRGEWWLPVGSEYTEDYPEPGQLHYYVGGRVVDFAGPLASDGENLYTVTDEGGLAVYDGETFQVIAQISQKVVRGRSVSVGEAPVDSDEIEEEVSGLEGELDWSLWWLYDLAWDGVYLWIGSNHSLLRLDPTTGEVNGWLPLPVAAFSYDWDESGSMYRGYDHIYGIASDGGRLYAAGRNCLWVVDLAYVCTEPLPEAVGICLVDVLNLRSGPSTTEEKIGEVRLNEPVYRLGTDGDWWRVYTARGQIGWAAAVWEGETYLEEYDWDFEGVTSGT